MPKFRAKHTEEEGVGALKSKQTVQNPALKKLGKKFERANDYKEKGTRKELDVSASAKRVLCGDNFRFKTVTTV